LTSHDELEPELIERGRKTSCESDEPVLPLEDDGHYHSHPKYFALLK